MNTWRPDIVSLRLFVSACDQANITQAAEMESLVPSAASKRIREMETALGVALLIRGNRGVRPTQAGHAFLRHAKQILSATERLNLEMAAFAAGVTGQVRVAASFSSMAQHLPNDIAEFVLSNPGIEVSLEEKGVASALEGVRDSAVDLAICPEITSSQMVSKFYSIETLEVLVHQSHPFSDRASMLFEDALPYTFVSLAPPNPMASLLSSLSSRYGKTIRNRLQVSTIEALYGLVAKTLGIAIVPSATLLQMRGDLNLHSIRLIDKWATRRVCLYSREEEASDSPVRLLETHLLSLSRKRAGTEPALAVPND